ncbi:ferredoxin--nitrite reductase [Fischerella thermalis]|jgi:ferredoxin-nitrite reductase|uniref:Ferredoxin--nitrite reductase n=15 Tax=Hapalosiphonaceae TaxID=1892263 RepID=G6FNQ2_9CYAN|nr:ferredoxin--nitrite reductase [Fischerella thermalis]APB80569.1 nitrite reductase [Mastigocladus sp. CHP1]EHC18905.1 Ferredoxin--nitrite reductase [Fischerella thermalis JSC-11]PLZ04804.1 ferredoxin--nitrite reductase [Fischerella thermalis WC119]PLZ07591.1 ferredoxin--nitrite reductase [Fischerella thermalis WC114]PLZ18066.1 ferredoxin--nitrite reductase [Fischerella thermalis WC1110]
MTEAVTTVTASLNKFEKFKAEKDGLAVKAEIEKFASIGWEAMDETDRDHRLKWVGVFFRPVTPGKFMMRMRMPNGIVTAAQMRVLAEVVQRYGDDGSADITTRQNIQLRGIRIEDLPEIFHKFHTVGLTSVQSGMDNVRNITGDPVAGLDADELFDTRELVQQIQDMLTNKGQGNPEFTNLPRKFNIAITGGRDNSVHAEINDLAFVPAFHEYGEVGRLGDGEKDFTPTPYNSSSKVFGFNILVGGFFSAKRCEAAIPLDAWVSPADVVAVCRAVLEVFRDHGLRANRQKSRLMWLIDEWGLEKFRSEVEQRLGKPLLPAAPKDEIDWEKRDHIGVYKQKQPELNYVGLHIPVGRLTAEDMFEIARLADVYGNGEIRLTVEQNVIIPNIPDSRLVLFLAEPLLEKFSIDPQPLRRSLVSCTGAQFCNFALIETKNRALNIIKALEEDLELTRPVRIHWTGCPNSCGQPQVADIGLMGTKARKNGKAVEGVDIYMGGKVGKEAHLGTCVQKGIPCEDLQPVLRDLLIQHFGAKPRQEALVTH